MAKSLPDVDYNPSAFYKLAKHLRIMIKIRLLLLLLFTLALFSCGRQKQNTRVANLYAPGTINTHMAERDAALSADSSLFFFTVQLSRQNSVICYSTLFNDKWMRPTVADFSGRYMDIEPVFHPDGRLFFCSNRPTGKNDQDLDFNIWFVRPTDLGWSEPEVLDTLINSPGNEYYPSFTRNGDLYFTATRKGGKGAEDLWCARFNEEQYLEPENLGDSINTSNYEYNSFVDPDGQFLLFTSHGWGEGFGGGDLFVSFKDKDGSWQTPRNLGPKVNTAGLEYCPSLSADGRYLFFSRKNVPAPEGEQWYYFEMMSNFSSMENGQGSIYYIDAAFIQQLNQ